MGKLRIKRKAHPALAKRTKRGFRGYPVATIAFYGPDDEHASKVAVGIVPGEAQETTALERWFSERGDVRFDSSIGEAIAKFIEDHGGKSVVMADRIIGCPHEEGSDYPEGAVCPQCPFWATRDRWTGETIH